MDVLNKFLNSIAYKFPKGYPDMNDVQDILLLESILKEDFGIILDEIGLFEVTLSRANFKKKPSRGPFKNNKNRIDILIDKINKGEPLVFNGKEIVIDKKVIKDLEDWRDSDYKLLSINLAPGKTTSDLDKTEEFGGQAAISTDAKKPVVDTEVKESLVIVFYNILKEGGNLKPFDAGNYANNFKIIKSSTDKFNDVESSAQNKINQLFDLIRSTCSGITGLPADKWNPGDIYLVNSTPSLPTETESIVPWNSLFVNEWGSTNAPLVSISLKEEKYQPGRAKSYLEKFGSEIDYNMSSEEFEYTDEQYKNAINKYRENITNYFDSNQSVVKKGNGWENFPTDRKQLQTKYGAYKLLNLMAQQNDASLSGLFAYGLSIDQDSRANPTFWKLIGKNNGSKASKVKYPAGVNTEMAEGEDITILDNSTNGGFTISGVLSKTKGDEIDTELVKLSFRTTGPGQVQIV
tara:strand:- start:791 stop:2179 length:1389 start_codon:yes stop_codon:yes gene_type:complete